MNKTKDKMGTLQQPMMFKNIIREYFENPRSIKLDNLEEIDKLLDAYDLLKLKHEALYNLNKPIISDDTEAGTESPGDRNLGIRWMHCWILPDILR